MDRRPPILWEEDERYRRTAARVLTVLFVSIVIGYAIDYAWRGEWESLRRVGEIVVGVLFASIVWSVAVWTAYAVGRFVMRLAVGNQGEPN
jgi:hypothetical protein